MLKVEKMINYMCDLQVIHPGIHMKANS